MNKAIISIGYVIPGHENSCVDFEDAISLMDADVLIISPDSIKPSGHWVNFSTGGGGCYDVDVSNKFKQKIIQLKKELEDHLKAGKIVFVFLAKEENESLASGVSSPRKKEHKFSTYSLSNYEFLPIGIGKLTSASGKHIHFSGVSIFSEFNEKFKRNMEYRLYVEDAGDAQVIFTGKDKSKILGATYQVGSGYLVTLPVLTFDEQDFTKVEAGDDGEEQEFWNDDGLAFGNNLVECLLNIAEKLTSGSEKTPPPEWLSSEAFVGQQEKVLRASIEANNEGIAKIQQANDILEKALDEERTLKDLLFEQGKPLENAVIKALKILGYKAENYDDGDLEMDQIIISPENHRYIGETEGKDNKDISVTKFRQLVDALNADFAREEVSEKAFGILFGNAERLKEPRDRKLDFTEKCKSGAEREKIALVRTIDLYAVTKYLNDNNDEDFKKACRVSIHKGLGKIVEFPKISET